MPPKGSNPATNRTAFIRRYQELVGVLWWAVELGRVDILLETAMMSTHLALPRKGHLEQLYHIFGYLKTNPKRKLFSTHNILMWMRDQSAFMIGMTSTTMQGRQFQQTCPCCMVSLYQLTVLWTQIMLAIPSQDDRRPDFCYLLTGLPLYGTVSSKTPLKQAHSEVSSS